MKKKPLWPVIFFKNFIVVDTILSWPIVRTPLGPIDQLRVDQLPVDQLSVTQLHPTRPILNQRLHSGSEVRSWWFWIEIPILNETQFLIWHNIYGAKYISVYKYIRYKGPISIRRILIFFWVNFKKILPFKRILHFYFS